MSDRTEFLIYARRLHNALRHSIEDGDGRTDDHWKNVERSLFEHYTCGMYLAGSLAFLEGRYGEKPWNGVGPNQVDFDTFLQQLEGAVKERFEKARISKSGIEALVCIRNAVTHNYNDLSKNKDKNCLSKVREAAIPGVTLNGTIVKLSSNNKIDFMEYVRKALVAVSMFHGDG